MRVPSSPLRGEFTTVRPATTADADLLVGWHAAAEIARYWDQETLTREQILLRLADSDMDPYIVEVDGEPVGYLQAWFDEEPGSGGLDMFLVPSARGRGLGPDAARSLALHIVVTYGLERLTVDPYLSNDEAIRAWAKTGFQAVAEREPDNDHTEPWLLMLFDASTAI